MKVDWEEGGGATVDAGSRGREDTTAIDDDVERRGVDFSAELLKEGNEPLESFMLAKMLPPVLDSVASTRPLRAFLILHRRG